MDYIYKIFVISDVFNCNVLITETALMNLS